MKQNIELRPGPGQLYNTKSSIHALKQFGQQILPFQLTHTSEAQFKPFLLEQHSEYRRFFPTNDNGKAHNVDKIFEI